jgi:hypothetical protein
LTDRFRCSAGSLQRDEPLAGTASTVPAFLLVENPGPWGTDAVRDARMPAEVKTALAAKANEAGVRVLLVRRHHRRAPREGFHVFAAWADPVTPWVETAEVGHADDLLGLDLTALGSGSSPGLAPYDRDLFCVCTHGKHDACCAERGRPVAATLTAAHPEDTWECSHIGGDRFAGNALVLPHGLCYGRLDEVSALTVAGAHRSGHLDLDHLRGRSGFAMPVQAAEIALRRELAETRGDALRLNGRWVDRRGDGKVTRARFEVLGAAYDVEVRTTRGPELHRLTCTALRDNPIPRHELLGVTRVRS